MVASVMMMMMMMTVTFSCKKGKLTSGCLKEAWLITKKRKLANVRLSRPGIFLGAFTCIISLNLQYNSIRILSPLFDRVRDFK